MDEDGPFKQKMLEIGDRYLRRTTSELQRLRDALAAVRSGDRSKLVDIGQIAHKVHGSGAMFGFNEVSAIAGQLEQCVEAHMHAPQLDDAAFVEHCTALIVRLDAETQRAAELRGLL